MGSPASEWSLEHAVTEVMQSFQNHPGFRHPFWEWMAKGEFDLPCLTQFALLYYEHVAMFRQYVARALSTLPPKETEHVQVALSRILSDEYGLREGQSSHPQLFRDFMSSIGLSAVQWNGHHIIDGIRTFRDSHFELFDQENAGLTMGAVIFGFEGTTPYRHGCICDGLAKFRERTGVAVDGRFFSEHVDIDRHHMASLIEPAQDLFRNSLHDVIAGAHASFHARKVFLDDLVRKLGIGREVWAK